MVSILCVVIIFRQILRWSWNDLCLFRINNESLYNARFEGFINFFNDFYKGIYTYSGDPKKLYNIFDIPVLDISFVAYNSCHNNDHLNFIGCINPLCITNSSEELAGLHKLGRLLVGVWHHHTSGLPSENNYLDYRILKAMIDKNIQIGLFGHQHEAHVINEYKNVIDGKRILLLSTGTLYGEKKSLPSGTRRQYNIIEIAMEDADIQCTVHLREDKSLRTFEIPSWSDGSIEGTSLAHWSNTLVRPKYDLEIILDLIITDVERNNDKNKAIHSLLRLDVNNISVRKILLEYLSDIENFNLICQYFINPKNNTEAIILMDAALNIGDINIIGNVLSLPYIKDNVDISVKEQAKKLKMDMERKSKWNK
jgi:hypothetical protein